jgi:hypothetical protein
MPCFGHFNTGLGSLDSQFKLGYIITVEGLPSVFESRISYLDNWHFIPCGHVCTATYIGKVMPEMQRM